MESELEWRPVVGYETLYQVSNDGRIRSTKRSGARGGEMKLNKVNGYLKVGLSRENKQTTYAVHRIVLSEFGRTATRFEQCNHKNGIKTDNRIENLEWCTCKENIEHSQIVLGYCRKGAGNGKSKLTDEDVKIIRWLRFNYPEVRACDLAEYFGVSDTNICDIWNFKKWKHI